jgi:hypothetical protein
VQIVAQRRALTAASDPAAQRLHAVAPLCGMRPFVEKVEVMAPQQRLHVRLEPRVAGGMRRVGRVSSGVDGTDRTDCAQRR